MTVGVYIAPEVQASELRTMFNALEILEKSYSLPGGGWWWMGYNTVSAKLLGAGGGKGTYNFDIGGRRI
jgi:hypothetical protein